MTQEPIPLRAHNLLCMQGFRGAGYSPDFVERMQEVHDRLQADGLTRVRLLTSPDTLCDACPHLAGGCTLHDLGHERHMRAQDHEVLERLGLEAGQVVPWAEVLDRIGARVRGSDLPAICTTCPWLPLGWCAEGIEALAPAGGWGDPAPEAGA